MASEPEQTAIARRMRQLARIWELRADEAASGVIGSGRPEAVERMHADEEAGGLVLAAHRRGWFDLPGFEKWAAWHAGDDSGFHAAGEDEPPTFLARCNTNVWLELVGNNKVTVRNTDGRAEIESNTHGGLLPAAYPELFPGSPYSRCRGHVDEDEGKEFRRLERHEEYLRRAQAAELVADIIEQTHCGTHRSSADGGTWTVPMSRAEVARRVLGNANARPRDIGSMIPPEHFREVSDKRVQVLLDGLDPAIRQRLQ